MDLTSPFADPDIQSSDSGSASASATVPASGSGSCSTILSKQPNNDRNHLHGASFDLFPPDNASSSVIDSPFKDGRQQLLESVTQDTDHPLSASTLAAANQPQHSAQSTLAAYSATGQPAHERYQDPPASIMLEIDSHHGPTSSPHSSSAKASKVSIFEQSKVVHHTDRPLNPAKQPDRYGNKSLHRSFHPNSNVDTQYRGEQGGDDDDEDPEALLSDEEAALMARQERLASSGTKSNRGFRNRDHQGLGRHGRDRRTRKGRRDMWSSLLPSWNVGRSSSAVGGLNPKQKALWMWANVDNMDGFLQEVYAYYIGKGAICIALSRCLNLITIGFVIGFSTFLLGCIDYSRIRRSTQLSDVIVGHCVSRFSNLGTLIVLALSVGFGWQVVQFGLGLSRLTAMHRFYTHVLNIPDADVQSIPWSQVVNRISALREEHPIASFGSHHDDYHLSGGQPSERLDAHDVANRIMRQENYLIALFNKDTLNLSIPGLRNPSPALTKSLEWNLNFCLLGFLFDSQGQVRHEFLSERFRSDLIDGLKRRFYFMAVVNAVFAPFIVLYLLMYSFFRYFEEYHKDPSNLGSRQYTQYARWKFREFNELPHLFRRRCHSSYPYAQRYLNQFPKENTAVVARFVAFIAGSFTAVLLLASVVDPDLFLHFDVTPQRNVLFYIGVFGTILAVARGMIPDEHLVFEPEILLRAVIYHTHYLPRHWKGKFHSTEVHAEFGSLYTLKVYIFFQELLSVIITPFVLWWSLPQCSAEIVDFFREFTVHVDGLGYVCSFAMFDFQRQGTARVDKGKSPATYPNHNSSSGSNRNADKDGWSARHGLSQGKLEQSILGFKANHPDWEPADPASSLFLSRMMHHVADDPTQVNPISADDPTAAATSSLSFGGGHNSDAAMGKRFTPVNSTLLAARSQFYDDMFARSIALAKNKDNAQVLMRQPTSTSAAAAVTRKSRSRTRREENGISDRIEEEEELDESGSFQDPMIPLQVGDTKGAERGIEVGGGGARIKDLLEHIYRGRGTSGAARW